MEEVSEFSSDIQKIVTLDAPEMARELLGWHLLYESPKGRVAGRIVETEAYTQDDPAAHSFRGKTERNKSLFERGGTVYIYFTYGMHYCLNIASGEKGIGQGVLLRAIEPVEGIKIMQKNRGGKPLEELTNGPAKLVEAFGIPKILNGTNIFDGPIHLERGEPPKHIAVSERIGIQQGKETLWRFYDAASPHLSRKQKV